MNLTSPLPYVKVSSSIVSGNSSYLHSPLFSFNLTTWLFLIQMSYGIPSILLYIRLVSVMSKPSNYRLFSPSFFRIYLSDCIVSMAAYLGDLIDIRIPSMANFGPWIYMIPTGYSLTFFYVFKYYTLYCTYFSTLIINFNRLTAVSYSTKHTRIWDRITKWCIVGTFVCPLLLIWYLFPIQTYVVEKFGMFGIDYYKYFPWIRHSGVLFWATCTVAIVCFVITATTLLFLSKLKLEGNKNKKRMEILAFLIGFLLCLALTLQAVIQCIQYFFTFSSIHLILYQFMPFVVDLHILTPPWILFIGNNRVWKMVLGHSQSSILTLSTALPTVQPTVNRRGSNVVTVTGCSTVSVVVPRLSV